jgi:multiple sugar transport system substrate-binding protein
MRTFDEQLQRVLTGNTTVDEALATSQQSWSSVIE